MYRTSLALLMAAASVVELCLIAAAVVIVLWHVGRIERAQEQHRQADRLQETALDMELHFENEAAAAWHAFLVGDERSRADFAGSATQFRAACERYAASARTPQQQDLARTIRSLFEEYTAHAQRLVGEGADGRPLIRRESSGPLLELVGLYDRVQREVERETQRLTATERRAAQERLHAEIRAMLTALAITGAAVLLAFGAGVLTLRYYVLQTVLGFTTALQALEAENVAFRLDWQGPSEFLPVAARFNDLQERLQTTTARKTDLEKEESVVRAQNEALSTEVAASAALLRVVQNAARAWRQTFDTVDFVLLTVDRDGNVQRVNRAALTLLGGTFEDWIGRPLASFPDKQPWKAVAALVRDVFADGHPLAGRIDDGTVWEYACTGVTDADDVAVAWARDITPMSDLQRTVARQEAMGAMGELLAGVAHEVRNPLFAITALLDAWSLKPHMQEEPFLPALRHEVTRMRQLMEELLEYGRPFNSSLSLGDLRTVAAEATSILQSSARSRGITICGAVSGVVHMDQARMLRVFLNLLQNAIDHSPPDTTIELASVIVLDDGGAATVEVTVRDHGKGFAAADLPRVFNPFFTRRQGGTGLGLPIVQRILDEHSGTVTAGNHPDGGALIRVRLPAVAAAEA